jgi:hypothetical protein
MMVQFNAALEAFKVRYNKYIKHGYGYDEGNHYWITEELLEEWETREAELEEEDGEDQR